MRVQSTTLMLGIIAAASFTAPTSLTNAFTLSPRNSALAKTTTAREFGTALFSNPNDSVTTTSSEISRRGMFGAVLTTTVSSALAGIAFNPLPASAAMGEPPNRIEISLAIRTLKKSIQELKSMESSVESNDYEAVKTSMRVPPLTEARKTCQTLIKASSDGESADTLQSAYGDFIKQIEALDSKAGLGMRGRKGIDLRESYDGTVKGLLAFEEAAERATGVPEVEVVQE